MAVGSLPLLPCDAVSENVGLTVNTKLVIKNICYRVPKFQTNRHVCVCVYVHLCMYIYIYILYIHTLHYTLQHSTLHYITIHYYIFMCS